MDTGSRSLLIAAVLIAIISAYLTLAGAAYERVSRAALRARHERGDARAERALAVLDGGERTAMAVLRCALTELIYLEDPDVTPGVAINEAVELAKNFEEPETVSFINGVLGGYMRSGAESADEPRA